jgi:thiol:disulfide interchange protein
MVNKVRITIGLLIFILLVLGGGFLIKNHLDNKDNLFQNITLKELDSLTEQEDYYVVFYTSTCATCNKFKKDFNEMKKENNIFENLKIYGINLEEDEGFNDEVLKKYNVQGVPFVIHFKKGKNIDMLYENIKKEDIKAFIK